MIKITSTCCILLLTTAIALAGDTPPVAVFYLGKGKLCEDGMDKGTPLPDGAEIKVFWDWDNNGPDPKDPQPVVGEESGQANFSSFKLSGAEAGLEAGQFYTDPAFVIVGSVPTPATYYLRVCLADRQLVSNVVKLTSGLADYEFAEWTVEKTPCKE